VPVLCREHGVSDASIYKWKADFGGMDVSEAPRGPHLPAIEFIELAIGGVVNHQSPTTMFH
jgi:Transposase.